MRSDLAAVTSAAIIATMSISTAASANDTEAEIGIGGLTFTKSANVEILSEDLYVSREQIVVKYLFRNTSRQDVDSLVAFPLPEFKYSGDIAERSGISDVEFTTQVDGEPVASKVEKKAFLFGTDVTSKLELSGIPLNPDEAVNALETISQETKSKLKHFELLDDNGSPTWTVKTHLLLATAVPCRPADFDRTSLQAHCGRYRRIRNRDTAMAASSFDLQQILY